MFGGLVLVTVRSPVAERTPRPRPNDFAELGEGELTRLLRGLRIETTGRETNAQLLQTLRFHINCDDPKFDKEWVPEKLQKEQIIQAYVHLFTFYFAPIVRTLQLNFMCRTVAGSDPDSEAADPGYGEMYLKSNMAYICYGADGRGL